MQDQALSGPIGETMSAAPQFEDNSRRIHREAWKSLGDMPREEAKRQFIHRLTSHFPHWPQWYTDHGQEHAAQVSGAQAPSQSQPQLQSHAQSQAQSHERFLSSAETNSRDTSEARSRALWGERPEQSDGSGAGVTEGRRGGDSLSDKLLGEFQRKFGLVLQQHSRL